MSQRFLYPYGLPGSVSRSSSTNRWRKERWKRRRQLAWLLHSLADSH
jgi:hypothetical protein